MKYLLSVVLFSAFTISAFAANVTVKFTNLRKPSGTLVIGIYNNAAHFPKEGRQFKKISIPVNDTSLTTTFGLPAGDYAFAVCHDEDGDGTCNQNFLGVPTEGFAFSNNFRPKLKAPKFSDVKITIKEDMKVTIKLLYF